MKIRDASSILLIDRRESEPKVLMGRRAAKHVFMPNVYVFPGGRVDYADRFAPYGSDYNADTLDLLLQKMNGAKTPLKARMLGLAAIRETFEEVGLLIGCEASTTKKNNNPTWSQFSKAGALPDLSSLTFLARAITPPGQKRRFDTRFFLCDVSERLKDQEASSSDELEDVRWVRLSETETLKTHFITKQMIKVAGKALNHLTVKHTVPHVPFYRAKRGTPDLAKVVTTLRAGQEPEAPIEIKVDATA